MPSNIASLILCILPILLQAAPLESRVISDTCQYTSPTNGDCNYDWAVDLALNSSDMRDQVYRSSFYASTYKAVVADDPSTPSRGGRGGGGRRKSRRDEATSDSSTVDATALFRSLNSYFQKVRSDLVPRLYYSHRHYCALPDHAMGILTAEQAYATITVSVNKVYYNHVDELTGKQQRACILLFKN